MGLNRFRLFAGQCFLVMALLGIAPAALAQSEIPPPESYRLVDANGVDLTGGNYTFNATPISIGPAGAGGLSYTRTWDLTAAAWRDTAIGTIARTPFIPPDNDRPIYTVTLEGNSDVFLKSGTTFTAAEGSGATLVLNGSIYTYTLADGTKALFDKGLGTYTPYIANEGQITSLTRPNGEVLSYTYSSVQLPSGPYARRLQSVTNNFGYQLQFQYAYDAAWDNEWQRVAKVTALNNAYDACAPSAFSCVYSRTWPSLTFAVAPAEESITDALGRVTRLFFPLGSVGVRLPTSTSGQDITVNWGPVNDTPQVASVAYTNGGTWTYGFGPLPPGPNIPVQYNFTNTVTDPLNHTQSMTFLSTEVDPVTKRRVTRIASATNPVNKTTAYGYDLKWRLSAVTAPEGNKATYVYNARGSITSASRVNKAGTQTLSTTAIYPATCPAGDEKVCNKPTSVTDARNNTTSYTYDTAHGGVLTATSPAPTSGAVQPQTRYSYAPYYAWFKNSGGTIVQGAGPIYLQTGTSACATLASCVGGADEVKTTTGYQTGSASLASNLFALSTTSGNGTGTLAATTSMTYNARGDVITVDGPIPGAADTTRSFFDSMRQKEAEILADPDGGGALLYPATRTVYNATGQVTQVQTGTTTSQADMNSFSVLEQAQNDYDNLGRKTKASFYAGGATQTLSQFSYDSANRLTCSTVRMNPAIFGSPPSSACTLGTTGSDGPDRVTFTEYDAADRVIRITSGYNSGASRIERQTTYTDNGKPLTEADGKGNLTTYQYDGFDRLEKARYPNATGGGSSTTDFDLYGYDANDNRTSWQRRGQSSAISFAFDTLNRQTSGLRGEVYAYDNLARRTSASLSGASVTLGYDALSRVLTETGNGYAMAYQYDLAGNRTRITWPDGVYVTYEYDNLYRTTAAKESGSSTLVGVAYDNLQRRTALTRLNGVTTSYGYDAASRLSSIFHNLTGTANDQTITMAYTPASQIRTKVGSNSLYDWTGTQLTGTYTANGLNQITGAGTRVPAYDARGNLSNDGVNGFTYDIANNLLTSTAGGGTGVAYDPMGRLRSITQGGGTTSLAYSGVDIVSEFDNAGTLFRRYVPGPNPDEHWVWYNGSGTTDRRFYLQDQVSSVIGLADNSGNAYAINAYDEYGVPRSGNQGRYQYTGQAWGASLGFYSFKARMYQPSFGRFLQSDPTGYDDGMNWYAYVANDPVNNTDPTGMVMQDRFDQMQRRRDLGDAVVDRQNRESFERVERGIGAIIDDIRSDPLGALADGAMIAADVVLGGPTGESAVGIGARRGAREGAEALATSPVGRRGSPMDVTPGTNSPGEVGGRQYTGHAFDQMQGRGIPPSAVDNAVQVGRASPDPIPGRTRHYDAGNNITVVTDTSSGRVITVVPGRPR